MIDAVLKDLHIKQCPLELIVWVAVLQKFYIIVTPICAEQECDRNVVVLSFEVNVVPLFEV